MNITKIFNKIFKPKEAPVEVSVQKNIETPEIVCKATDHIKEMLEYVKKLVENGYAYETSTAI